MKLSEVAEINPRKPSALAKLPGDYRVTFVPMAAVDEGSGTITQPEVRTYAEVKKGFTYFAEGDVIFAKITPCMQNGKAAIASCLENGVGFGSTEFHVIRPLSDRVTVEWLWYFVRQPLFRKEAVQHFRGSAGQQRVPESFLAEHTIPVPTIEIQTRVIGRVKDMMRRIGEIGEMSSEIAAEGAALPVSMIEESMQACEGNNSTLGSICEIASSLVDPRESKYQDLKHVGGANIVSGTGAFVGLKTAREEELISGKFLFSDQDVLYSKIRPYLRKVARPDFKGLCSADMYPLRVKDMNRLDRGFLFYLLLSRRFTDYANKVSNRAGMPKINREQLFAYEFKLPTLTEQQQIVERADRCFSSACLLNEEFACRSAELEAITQSILRKAFAGEL
jgi:type I restriction enzyme S subunit